MAITAVGYDGTLYEQGWAAMARFLSQPVAESSTAWRISAVAGQDRKVRSAVGKYYADGVLTTADTVSDLTLPITSGSPKWWTISLNLDWTVIPNGQSSLVYTGGGTTQAVNLGSDTTPGIRCNYPLALVEVRAGVQVPSTVIDLRDTLAEVRDGWKPWIPITKPSTILDSPANGHTWAYRLSVPAGRVEIRGAIAAADGNFSGSGDFPLGSPLPVEARPNRVQRHTAQSSNMNAGNSSNGTTIYINTTRAFINTAGQIHCNNTLDPAWINFDGWVYDTT